jgi:hypothetical protein
MWISFTYVDTTSLHPRDERARFRRSLVLSVTPFIAAGKSADRVYANIGSHMCLTQVKDAARTGAGPDGRGNRRMRLLGAAASVGTPREPQPFNLGSQKYSTSPGKNPIW